MITRATRHDESPIQDGWPGFRFLKNCRARKTLIEAAISSGMAKGQNLVVNQSGSERQGLPDVLVFEFRIFAFEFGAVGVSCQCLKNAADGKTEISNARFAVHPRGVDRDSVKFLHAEFSQSWLEQETGALLPMESAVNHDFPEHTRTSRRKHQRALGNTRQIRR